MLRITITDGDLEQRWILQGRLVAPWVAELETSWKKRSRNGVRRYVVDVSEVTLIDRRGEKALKAMRRAGAELIASGVYLRHVVEGINSQCKRSWTPGLPEAKEACAGRGNSGPARRLRSAR